MSLALTITIIVGVLLCLGGALKTMHDLRNGKFPGVELRVFLAGAILAMSVPAGGWAANWATPQLANIDLSALPAESLRWVCTGVLWLIVLTLLPSWREIEQEYAMERGAGLFSSLRDGF